MEAANPSPQHERQRLEALERYGLPRAAGGDPALERLVDLACHTFDAPIAFVTAIEEWRLRVLAARGDVPGDLPRSVSLCQHVIAQSAPLVIEDATADPRFRHSPMVTGPPHLRFYAAAPMRSREGLELGTLCVADTRTRGFSDAELKALESLAALGEDALELRHRRGMDQEEAAAERESELRILLDNIPQQLFYLTDAVTFGRVNQATARFKGMTVQQMEWKSLAQFLAPEEVEVCRRSNQPVFDNKVRVRAREWVANAEGEPRLLDFMKVPVLDEHGAVKYVVCVGDDVTESHHTELQRDRLLAILEAAPDCIAMADAEGNVLYRNPAMRRLLGEADGHGFAGRTVADAHPAWAARLIVSEGLPTARDEGVWRGETAVLTADEEEVPVSQLVIAHYGEDGRVERYSTIMHDISEYKRMEAALVHQATHDRLTGLYNRELLEEFLNHEINRAERDGDPLSMLLFDVDHFKRLNDTHGHHAGDQVLRQLGALARNVLRQSDILVRWGGEEFLAILPRTNAEGARRIAERLREAVHDHTFAVGEPVSISAGVAEYRPGECQTALTKRADDALYEAKRRGRNRVEPAA